LRNYKDAQFIISTHSPVLLGYPGAQILSFDEGHLHQIDYEDTAPMQIVRRFVNDRDSFLQELFQDNLSLFEEGQRLVLGRRRSTSRSDHCQAPKSPKPIQTNNIHLSYELYPTRYTEYRNQNQHTGRHRAGYPICNLIFACKPSGMNSLQGEKIASRSIEAT
jgi:hypothetical protein